MKKYSNCSFFSKKEVIMMEKRFSAIVFLAALTLSVCMTAPKPMYSTPRTVPADWEYFMIQKFKRLL